MIRKYSMPNRSVIFIYICTLFYWMSMYIYLPVFSVYAGSLGADLTVIGIIVAAFGLPQFLFRMPLGVWSDSVGRQKPFIIGGILILIAGSIGLWLAANPLVFGISRVLVGIGAAAWVVFPVFLLTFYQQENVGQTMGILNFVYGASRVIATLLGGVISNVRGEKFVFFVAALLALVSLGFILFTRERPVTGTVSQSWRGLGQAAHNPLLLFVSIAGALLFFAEFSTIWGFFPLYAANIGASDTTKGIITMMVTIGAMMGSLTLSPMVKRWGNGLVIIISSLMSGLTLLAIPLTKDLFLLGSISFIHGLGYGIIYTQLMAMCIYHVAPQLKGTAMGFFQAIYAFGMIIGPVISGFLSNNYGLPIVFYISGLLCLMMIGLAGIKSLPRQLA